MNNELNNVVSNDESIHKGVCKMKLQEVRQIAKRWGIDTKTGRTKQDIIRDIQLSEGYDPCFGTRNECENDCIWKKDCIGLK